VAAIVYSLLTDYELGLYPLINMRTHLWLDAAGGIFFIISPWLPGFAGSVWIPHVAFGIFEIVAAMITKTRPMAERKRLYDQAASAK
jgi:hypothetical protein